MNSLRAEELCRTYPGGVEALRGVSLSVGPGDIVVVLGPSGSGKTTLLNLLATLDTPTAGTVWLDDTRLSGLDDHAAARLRCARFGFIFQFFHLLPELTVLENVFLPLWVRDRNPLRRERFRRDALLLLEEFGMAGLKDAAPSRLSGGEMQRVAICRSLVCGPDVVFADEPTGSIDRETAQVLFDTFRRLAAGRGTAFVIATHNERFLQLATKVVYLRDGMVERRGPGVPGARRGPDVGPRATKETGDGIEDLA